MTKMSNYSAMELKKFRLPKNDLIKKCIESAVKKSQWIN